MAKRIRLSRAKGWRMPENTVKVDRSTKWGNPFTIQAARDAGYVGTDGDLRAMVVDSFRRWLNGDLDHQIEGKSSSLVYILDHIGQLRGHDLACWCPPGHACHADVLLALANAPEASG